jgi:CTP synthase (UTP-ammonia lyase)
MANAVTRLTILGEYSSTSETQRYTDLAVRHSALRLALEVEVSWISSVAICESILAGSDALWIAPGGLHRDLDKTLSAIRLAREQHIPTLGTCGGFQHMVLEYAQNVLGIADAQHAEYEPSGARLVISPLSCSLKGRTMRLSLAPGSRAAALYGSLSAEERYYCSFGIGADFVPTLRKGEFHSVGEDEEGAIRMMEMDGHPFFMGTLFVPQARSSAAEPHPLVTGFIAAAALRWHPRAQARVT